MSKQPWDPVGDEADLELSWLKMEVNQEQSEDTIVEILPSPDHIVGTSINPRHRVIQVCVGAEHGVMRTDAGIAFTWGDNRYGQLGRPPVLKEENGTPYPVLDLLEEEIVMVAAGKNHCLALTADGGVKAWGRNKQGQLGIGNYRDKTEPKWVRLNPIDESGDLEDDRNCPKLGGVAGDRNSIVCISAGGNSSIAAGTNSDVWQWGELNSEFKMDDGKDKKKHGSRDKDAGGGLVPKARPYRVASWKGKSFRTQMRKEKEKVSISESLCMVLAFDKADQGQQTRIKDLVEEDKRWRTEIAKERGNERDYQQKKRSMDGDAGQNSGDAGEDGNIGDLQDTISFLERDIDTVLREIDLFKKNVMSCEQQQKHNRKQIEMLTHQATQLTESQGNFSQQMLEGKKTGQQKKQLETQLNEIKDFIEANANTRATLLDQRAETDKEKQRLSTDLQAKEKQLLGLEKRLEMVKFLGSSAKNTSGASDQWVSFLGKEKDDLTSHFEGKPLGNAELLEAKKRLEKDESYLRRVEYSMHEKIQSTSERGHAGHRPETCRALLNDLVDLRRRLNDLSSDKYFKEDLNFECFFKGAKMPEES